MGKIKVGYHTITWGEDFERALEEIKKQAIKFLRPLV